MADTGTFSAAMKTKFIGPIRDSLHQGKVLLFGDPNANPGDFKGILSSAENIDFVGNQFQIPLKASRNQAVGFRSENETLPAPGASKYTYLTEPMRYAYGLFNITGQLMKASESNEGAFKVAFKAEMEDTVLTSKIDHNRAAFGDGSGSFAAVRTNAAGGVATVDVSSTINFRGGEIIDFVNAAGTVISPAHTVTAVSRSARTITFAPVTVAALTATTHLIVRASSDSTIAISNNSQNREIQGLKSLVDTATLHGVNPANYPFWKSYVNPVNGAISDSVIRDGLDTVGFESGLETAGNDFALVTTRGIRRRYADTLISVKRFTNADSVNLHGGFKTLQFDEHPIFTDDQCDLGYLYGLNLKDFFWSQLSDWEWMEEDGKVLKWEARKDRYTAVLFKYCQLGMTRRNGSFKLTGITDDVK
jgi:hypothetical protein